MAVFSTTVLACGDHCGSEVPPEVLEEADARGPRPAVPDGALARAG